MDCHHPRHFFGHIVDSRGVMHRYSQCERCGALEVVLTQQCCKECEQYQPTAVRDGWGWCPHIESRVCGLAWRCEGGFRDTEVSP